MRARWAFILAPIIPAILPGYNWHANHPETGPLSGFIFVTLVFYVVEAVVGIPAFYVLTRRRWQFFWVYVVVGFLAVFVPAFVFGLIKWSPPLGVGGVLYACSFIGILGGATGLIFWFLVRPDKDRVEQIASHFT
ncbi:hypothetical protein NKJ88_30005 [Mesorhizobium sp. M0016]|uniref:hypothetical protein n=1 Tax=Mesorhizobium sp. M0016 TaxID=2956843 RepID=UPI003335B0A8